MPKYRMTNGDMIDKKKIDRLVSEAKRSYLEMFFDEHGYFFCERTKRSDLPLDCSHIISVKECQESGRTELAWNFNNIELLCRESHLALEDWSKEKRQEWYYARIEELTCKEFHEQNKGRYEK